MTDVTDRPAASGPIKLGPMETGTNQWSESLSSHQHRDQPREELHAVSLCLPQLPAPLPHTCYTPVSIPASVLTCGWLLGFSQALPGPHDAVPRARIAASGYTVYGGKFDKCLFD